MALLCIVRRIIPPLPPFLQRTVVNYSAPAALAVRVVHNYIGLLIANVKTARARFWLLLHLG